MVVGDSSFAAIDLLNAVRDKVTPVSRLRSDAALYRKARARRKGQPGRGGKKGKRLPTLQAVIDNPKTKWKTVRMKNRYGEQRRTIEIASGKCVRYHTGKQAVPIRRVIIRDPHLRFETQAIFSTGVDASPKQIARWYIERWQLEVTFEESRRHLGIETRRQWSDKAINRATPCLFGLYWLITMMARELCEGGKLKIRSAVRYQKELATFSAAIGCVRQQLWESQSFQTSEKEVETIKIPRSFVETLTETLCFVT